MDTRVQQILPLLASSLDANTDIRQAGERALHQHSQQHGFGAALANIALTQGAPTELRQLAAVLLKQYIKKHWVDGERDCEPPVATDDEKRYIKDALPSGLAEANSKVRTAIGMAIARIATWDYPEQWPGLLEHLVGAIKSGQDANMVYGALSCLSMLSEDIDARHVPQMVQELVPHLQAIAQDGSQLPCSVRRQALTILHHLLKTLPDMDRAYQRQVRDLLAPHAPGWVQLACGILAQPMSAEERSDWGLRMECLGMLVQLVTSFSKFIQGEADGMMRGCWLLLLRLQQLHQQLLVEGEGEGEAAGSDDDEGGADLEGLISQMFEVLMTVCGNERYQSIIKPALPQLASLALAFMAMTAQQEEAWGDSSNQYVIDMEEDCGSARASAEMLLYDLCEAHGQQALATTMEAVCAKLQQAQQLRGEGQGEWWRQAEAALQGLGGLYQQLCEALQAKPGSSLRQGLDQVLAYVLQEVLAKQSDGNGFLTGRALWLGANMAPVLRQEQATALLQAAAAAVAPGSGCAGIVKISACRAIAKLAPRSQAAVVQPLLPSIYSGLVHLLQQTSDETQHLVLQCLKPVVQVNPEAAAFYMAEVAAPVLRIWESATADPLLSQDSLEVLQAFANNSKCLPLLAQHVTPRLAEIVSSPGSYSKTQPMLVTASLDLLCVLVRPGQAEVVQGVARAVLPPLLHLVTRGHDNGEVQNATQLLYQLMAQAGPQLLQWGAPDTLQHILAAAQRLLSPSTDESLSMYAGRLVHEMLRSLPAQTAPSTGSLLQALVDKLVACKSLPTVSNLLLALCKMLQMDTQKVLDALQHMVARRPDGSAVSGLQAVMPVLLETGVSEVYGTYATNLAISTLVRLLECRGHPGLAQAVVKGKQVVSSSGVRTRSQAAKEGGNKYTQVAVPVKLVCLLAEFLAQHQEVVGASGADEAYSEDADDDDVSHHSLDDDDLDALRATGHNVEGQGPRTVEELLAYNLDNATDEAAIEEEPRDKADALYQLDLPALVGQALQQLAAQDAAFCQACGSELSAQQARALQALFHK